MLFIVYLSLYNLYLFIYLFIIFFILFSILFIYIIYFLPVSLEQVDIMHVGVTISKTFCVLEMGSLRPPVGSMRMRRTVGTFF